MKVTKANTVKKTELFYSLLHASYWAGNVTALSFALVYLKICGVSNTAAGYIFAMYNIVGFLLSNFISYILDRSKHVSVHAVLTLLLSIEGTMLVFLLFQRMSVQLTAGVYLVYMTSCLPALTLITQLYTDAKHSGMDISFANARWKGSLSFAVTSVLLGWLTKKQGYRVIPIVGLALVLMQLCFVLCFFLQTKAYYRGYSTNGNSEMMNSSNKDINGRSFSSLCRQFPRFAVLILGIGLVLAAHKTLNNFLYNAVINLGGSTQIFGLLTFLSSAVEIMAMFMFQKCRRIKLSSLLIISLVCFPLKLLFVALASNIVLLFLACSLQMLSFGLYTPTIVDYVNNIIPFEDSAKAQGLIITMPALASFVLNGMIGHLFDMLSTSATIIVLSAISACGVGLCIVGIDRTV